MARSVYARAGSRVLRKWVKTLWGMLAVTVSVCDCDGEGIRIYAREPALQTARAHVRGIDGEANICRARVQRWMEQPDMGGAPQFDALRAEIFGRVRGEPMVFVRAPIAAFDAGASELVTREDPPYSAHGSAVRVVSVLRQYKGQRPQLRAALLPEGYVYSEEPREALALVREVRLPMLFDEPAVFLHRGAEIHRLRRTSRGRDPRYEYVDGPRRGREVQLIFGDRVAAHEAALDRPLHRDLQGLARDIGFDRANVVHRTEPAIVADLRFGSDTVRAVLRSEGALLSLECVVAGAQQRARIAAARSAAQVRLRALRAMRETIDEFVDEALRFDRPRHEDTAELDGRLRPGWWQAYRRGLDVFAYEGESYPVYDAAGRAWPPQVCVDLVLDTYERTSGTWFRARGERPDKTKGLLDFGDYGIVNRRGVLALARFAESQRDMFEVWHLRPEERIRFEDRARFFRFLVEHADDFVAGDVVAIQGLKRDGRIHQHAILVESTDPVTGFAYGLADQMKVPRRRTWEGIMAEAPLRSILFRIRPRDPVFSAMDRVVQ